MSDIKALIEQRDEILNKIREIEESSEGIENENNAKKITDLNKEKSNLITKKNEISTELSKIEQKLNKINEEINSLSGSGIDRILEAIKTQRWYFFKNKPKVLMDKETGLLWANLDYFKYYVEGGDSVNNRGKYNNNDAKYIVNTLSLDDYNNWQIPTLEEFIKMIKDKTFPFKEGNNYSIKKCEYWVCSDYNDSKIGLDELRLLRNIWAKGNILPCNSSLVYESYKNDIIEDNKVYTEKEKLQFTLNLFIDNNLEPIFNDAEITKLYRKIFIEKPALMESLNEIQSQINSLQEEVLLSSTFDYNTLLAKYDIKSINSSVIKYYEAVKQWIDELMDKLHYYESVKSETICNYNAISLLLAKDYEYNPNLTEEENFILKDRQDFLKKNLELGMNNVNAKLLSIKNQAINLENRIDEIDMNDNSIEELAKIEKEERASFEFIAENTAKIIKNALLKIERFEKDKDFITNIIKYWNEWTEDYKNFKVTKKETLKNVCEDDGIDEEERIKWFNDWNNRRFYIEKRFLPLVERGIKGEIISNEIDGKKQENIIEQVIKLLKQYKYDIDNFYLEERKSIYQKFAFQAGGDLQEKFEVESELYKITSRFQKELQTIIFKLNKVEDRMFLLNWASDIIDLQIDEILYFIKDKELNKISEEIINKFANLKRKNLDTYISDAKSYSEELARREKEYNSLIFKMRKDLINNKN